MPEKIFLLLYLFLLFSSMRGCRFAGRFAQARGNSSWARQFNSQVFSKTPTTASSSFRSQSFFTASRTLSSAFIRCAGEVPLNGFAEQYRTIANSMSSVGEACSNGDSLAGESDAQIVIAGNSVGDELEFVQIAEVPTLFTYCHHDFEMTPHSPRAR